jgi:hypothetical protein
MLMTRTSPRHSSFPVQRRTSPEHHRIFRIKADLSTRGKTPLAYSINSVMFVLVAHLNRSAVPVSGRFEPSIKLTAVNPFLSAFRLPRIKLRCETQLYCFAKSHL